MLLIIFDYILIIIDIIMRVKAKLIEQIPCQNNRTETEVQISEREETGNEGIQVHNKTFKEKKCKCIVCGKKCNYQCPKCSKNYCGIEHFRSHNLFCSQAFYQTQVQENLKGLKIRDTTQKRKTIQLVNEFKTQIDNEQAQIGLSQQRLQQILKQIQSGDQVLLTNKQETLFAQYLHTIQQKQGQRQQIQANERQKMKEIQIQKGYWEVEQGMCFYICDNVQIQQYNQSQYPQLLLQREIFKKRLQQFKLEHPFSQTVYVIKPILNVHLLQIIYAYVCLWRAHDGQCSQFAHILCQIYCCKQNQAMLRNQNITLAVLIKCLNTNLALFQQNKQGIKSRETVLNLWVTQYQNFVTEDLLKIVNNQYLVIQTLMRIIDCVNVRQTQSTKDAADKNTSGIKKGQKGQAKEVNKVLSKKVIKKCEYLLYMVTYNFKKQVLRQMVRTIEVK